MGDADRSFRGLAALTVILGCLLWAIAGAAAWAAEIEVKPVGAKTDAEAKQLKDDFKKAVDDAAKKSPAFAKLLARINGGAKANVIVYVRKDGEKWIDNALEHGALGVTDLNLTNLLRFPNPDFDPAKPAALKMPDGFPDWAVTRTEILYHILDEAYLGAKSDPKDGTLESLLKRNHAKAITEQEAVRLDFRQIKITPGSIKRGMRTYEQTTTEDGALLKPVMLGGVEQSPAIRFSFLLFGGKYDRFALQNTFIYIWFDADRHMRFRFEDQQPGATSKTVSEPSIPDGGYAMAEGTDQPNYASGNLGTPQVATQTPAAGLTPLEMAVLAQINFARANPQAYAAQLAAGPQTTATRDAIAFLDRQAALPPFTASDKLTRAAEADAADEGSHGLTGHTGSDGSSATQRMQRQGVFASVFAEEISFGQKTAEGVVRQLVIDEGSPNRAHRNDLFDHLIGFAGVGCGPHTTQGSLCVIDLTSAMLAQ